MNARIRIVTGSSDGAAAVVTEIVITTSVVPPGDPAMPGDITVLGIGHGEAITLLYDMADVLHGGEFG